MRDYRRMQVAYRVFSIGMAVVCFVCCQSYAQVGEALPLEDPNAVLQIVLSAVKNIQLPLTGRGTAIMKAEKYRKHFDDKELTVDFVFKDQTSRTDIFESSSGTKGSRLFARVVSDKQLITLNPQRHSAEIAGFQRHRDIGLDFHPAVFMDFKGVPLTKWLEILVQRPPTYTSAEVDAEGILHIIAGTYVVVDKTGEGYDHEMKFLFDTRKGFLPVSYSMEYTHPDPGKGWSAEVEFAWAKYDSAWYLSRAEYIVQPGNRQHRVITVKKFTPNVEVSDEEFTLDGLGISDGLLVADKIAGVAYRYGSSSTIIEDLDKPLEEADFVQKIREQQPALMSQAADANAQKVLADQNQLPAFADESVKPEALAEAPVDSLRSRVILIISAVVLITVIAFLGYKFAVIRAKS